MWWPQPAWYEAHNSPGTTVTGHALGARRRRDRDGAPAAAVADLRADRQHVDVCRAGAGDGLLRGRTSRDDDGEPRRRRAAPTCRSLELFPIDRQRALRRRRAERRLAHAAADRGRARDVLERQRRVWSAGTAPSPRACARKPLQRRRAKAHALRSGASGTTRSPTFAKSIVTVRARAESSRPSRLRAPCGPCRSRCPGLSDCSA